MPPEKRKHQPEHDDPVGAMMAGHPPPVRVVADSRDTWLRRLSLFAVVMIVLFFSALGQQQTRDNHQAIKSLSGELDNTSRTNHLLLRNQRSLQNDDQKLRALLRKQNSLLRAAGLPTVRIPAVQHIDTQPITSNNPASSSPRPRQSSSQPPVRRTPRPKPSSHPPGPKPSPSKSGQPNPVQSLVCTAKRLLAGKC